MEKKTKIFSKKRFSLEGKFMTKERSLGMKRRKKKNNYVRIENIPKTSNDFRKGYRYYVWTKKKIGN